MKPIKINLIQKTICIFAIVLIPLFLVVLSIMQNFFEGALIKNAKDSFCEFTTEEGKGIEEYFRKIETIGLRSVEFIKQELKKSPDETELQNFNRKYQVINGALRTNLEAFPDKDVSGAFLSDLTPLNDEIKKIIIDTEGSFDNYGKGVVGVVFNMYLITKQNFIRIYRKDWALEIEPNHNFYNDTFYYVADPQHSPNRKAAWTEVYYDSIWKHWMTSLITPIYLGDDFLGIVGHDVILDDIYKEILQKKYYDTGYGFIFDAKGNVVIHPHYLKKLQETAAMSTTLKFSDLDEKSISECISQTISGSKSGDTTIYIDFEENGERYHFYAYKLDFLNWYFAIIVPHNEVVKLLPQFRFQLTAAAIVLSAFVFAVAIIVLWFLVISPLVKVSKAVKEISKGNLDYKISYTSHDEIGTLASSFNTMTSNLKDITTSRDSLNREITEREKIEEWLQTRNQQLLASQQQLKATNQQLQEFVYVTSHDLREPSRKISTFGQLLTRTTAGKLNDDEKENLSFMIDGADRMRQMVESLLIYLGVITKPVKFEKVNLNGIVEYLKNRTLAVELEQTGGTILAPEPLLPVSGDPAQIHRLFQNLISNALKYHKENVPPEVTIRTFTQEDNMTRVEVEDNGIGIKAEHHNNVFVMFKRLNSREEYNGTGIGLPICKRIVERHGGDIGVNSIYGQGATFWFTIPAVGETKHKQRELDSSLKSN